LFAHIEDFRHGSSGVHELLSAMSLGQMRQKSHTRISQPCKLEFSCITVYYWLAVRRVATETDKNRRRVMIANVEQVPKQARPALQADGGDVNMVNVNNRVERLKLKGVYGAAQRRNHA